ncbi:MAG: CrcB family protein [Acidimicrobiia bacterium]|nr:CrcB family protein [Acidimicrobiia bacterium]
MTALAFVVLALAGTVARAVTGDRLNHPDLPVGTFVVNVVGSFLLGLVATRSPEIVTIVGTGALGSFTTFSTLTYESVTLIDHGRGRRAAGYLTVTIVAGIAAAWLGLRIAD